MINDEYVARYLEKHGNETARYAAVNFRVYSRLQKKRLEYLEKLVLDSGLKTRDELDNEYNKLKTEEMKDPPSKATKKPSKIRGPDESDDLRGVKKSYKGKIVDSDSDSDY